VTVGGGSADQTAQDSTARGVESPVVDSKAVEGSTQLLAALGVDAFNQNAHPRILDRPAAVVRPIMFE
jgi:hypothetical protein